MGLLLQESWRQLFTSGARQSSTLRASLLAPELEKTAGMSATAILLITDSAAEIYLVEHAVQGCSPEARLRVMLDSSEVLAFLRQGPPSLRVPVPELILLDLKLPQTDGAELIAAIRRLPAYRPTPILVLSRAPQEEAEAQCLRLGANVYFHKVVNFYDNFGPLRALLRHWLRDSTRGEPAVQPSSPPPRPACSSQSAVRRLPPRPVTAKHDLLSQARQNREWAKQLRGSTSSLREELAEVRQRAGETVALLQRLLAQHGQQYPTLEGDRKLPRRVTPCASEAARAVSWKRKAADENRAGERSSAEMQQPRGCPRGC